MKNTKLRKALSVFLSVLMLLSCWVWVAPTDAKAADGNKYYVKVYVNIYDGSDGYGGTYSVEESTGKPKNYSWATNDGWYGRINMTGFTVFGEGGDYDAQDVSAALLEAEKLNTWYAMSGLSDNNNGGDWDSKAIAKAEYTFVLDSFPVEIFWMNDENNWDGGNTGFAIRKLTVATSEGGTEHTMWEGLAGSDSETYNYYGSITPTGIHTCFEDYAKNYDMNDYKFYKAITSSSQRAWTDPYTYGSAGTYYLNEYANGGVSATFSEGATSVASTVDYIDTSSTDTYYVNYTNHSKTQIAEITGTYNDGNFVSSPYGIKLNPGETRSFEINKSNYSKLAKYNNAANFTFEYTLSNVYASDEINASLAKFIQPTYIGLWNEANDSPKYITDEDGDGSTGYTLKLSDSLYVGDNSMTMTNTFQVTEGIIERNSATTGSGSNSVTFNYNYYVDVSNVSTWEDTGLRIYVTEDEYYRLPFQPKEYPSECGTITLSGNYANTDAASITIADIAFTNVTEKFWYSHSQASGYSTYGYYNQKGTPMWATQGKDAQATFYNNNPGWLRFAGTMIEPSDSSADPAKIVMDKMVYRENQDGQKVYFSGTINVYAFDKAELRDYIQKTLLDFAPMSLRYNTTAFETYQNKLAAAMNVLADQKTNQLTINSALAELKSAVEALQTTDNLINQVAELTHVQYVDDIGSEVAASIPERYVLIPLGEHTVPQNTAYIGNGTYKDATNKKSNLTTNYAKTDTAIETLKYYYWNIEFAEYDENRSVVDFTIENLETAIAGFDSNIYSNDYYKALVEAKKALEAIDQNDGTNSPSTQEEVETAIINADNLLAHLGNNMRVHKWIEDDQGNYVAESDKDTHWYTCSICGYELVYNHTFAYEKIDAAEHKATCVTSGTDEGCGYSFTEDHIWVEGETVATSCTEANKSFSCICGATKTEAVTVSNHNFVVTDNGDGTHISKCSKCGANETDATAEAHTYTYKNNNDGTHIATCSVCFATETVAHTFINPVLARPTLVDGEWVDGTYTSYCVCGAEKVEPAERADYSELDEIVEALKGLQDNENLTDEAKKAITDAIAKDDALADDLVTAEQKDIDDLVKELQKVKADVDEAIKNKEIGVEKITEANSGVKVQFIKADGLGEIDSVQLGKDTAFKIRVANGNADSNITITNIQGEGVNTTGATLNSGESADYGVTMPTTAGIKEYTITYTIDGLKNADGTVVTATTKAYIYVKDKAVTPYHLMDENCANNYPWEKAATSEWGYYLGADIGDFEVVHNYKAPHADFGITYADDGKTTNLVQDKTGGTDYVKDQYDYEDENCYAGCPKPSEEHEGTTWSKGDAHAATYRYYIDTSLAETYEDAGLHARIEETENSLYDRASFVYVRLANNQTYLNKIPTDKAKTFSTTLVPHIKSNVPNKTWVATSTGDVTVSELKNSNKEEFLFGSSNYNSENPPTAYANFSGAIPQNSFETAEKVGTNEDTEGKLMFSWRMEFYKKDGGVGAQVESVTMTTHLYITSYDKAALREAVEKAEQAGYNSAYFNAEKYEAYENALKTAKEVLGKAETNQGEIDEATAALNTAIENLTKAENEAKFVLTVTHSIHENDKDSAVAESIVDYYLLEVGKFLPALNAEIIARDTINKYDAVATINVTADTEHTYNYWYIDYSGVQGAIDAADAVINDTENGYSEAYKQQAQNAKDALENILNGKEVTTTPESQKTVNDAIGAVGALTHTCADGNNDHKCDTCGTTLSTCADSNNDHKCDICGTEMGTHADSATDNDHLCDYGCGATLENCSDVETDKDHNCDICGKADVTLHEYVNPVLTRPTKNEDGTWKKGYYTSTCNCGDTTTTEAERATYTAYDEAKSVLESLLTDKTITDAAKTEIEAVLEANKIADNYIATEEEQAIVDAAAAALKAELDKFTDENGELEDEYKKPDYTKWEEAEGRYDALDKKNVKDNIIKEAENLKKDIAEKQANASHTQATATQAQINAATERLNQIIAGINDGTLKDPDYSGAENAIQDAKDTADSENIPDNKELEIEAEIAELERQLEELKNTNPDSTNAEANEKIEEIKGKAEAIVNKYVDCVAGTHNYADATCTSPKTCSVCGATEGEALGHSWGAWSLTTAPTATKEGTYTRTCSKGDATETKSVARENYSAYDEAIKKAEELLKKDELTQAAKDLIEAAITEAKKLDQNLPEDVVENDKTIIDNDSAEKIAEATGKLNEVLNGIVDEEGNLKDEYKKPDTKAAEDAVGKAEALNGKIELPADIETQIDELREELNGILEKIAKDGNATEAEYKDDLKKVEDAANVILNKYAACEKDGHKFGTEVIATYPVYDEETKTWSQGTYTKTCSVCGYVKTIVYNRANYEAYDKALADLNALLANDNITEATKTEIREVINKNTIRNDLMTPDQDKVTAAADALKAEVDKITNDATGAYEKVDYTNYNAAVNAYNSLVDVMSDADKTAVEAIKTEIAKIPADGSKKDYQTQVDKAAADIAAINGKYGDCATGNHVDTDHNHNCDICGTKVSECTDTDTDHDCDICGTTMGTHEDVDPKDHNCDYCDGKITDCADTDKNHKCDICDTTLSECADTDKNHKCDICGTEIGTHADTNNDHNCEYCNGKVTDCVDADTDHDCDICGTEMGTHADTNNDHNCEYCNGKVTDCLDADTDHDCDICGTPMGAHADSATDSDHVCDYGCGETLENCTDVDNDTDHNCDICGDKLSDCSDVETDTDHDCDICGAKNITEHNYVDPELTRPTQKADGTWSDGYYTSTCNCGATKTESAERATYTEYDNAKAALEALKENASITADAKAEIEKILADNDIEDNRVSAEQSIVDAAANALKAELEKLTDENGKLEDGYKKPDYTKWEEAETAYDKLDITNVKSDIIAEVEGLKKQIADKQADDSLTQATATQTEINNATARLNQIIAGIKDGSLLNSTECTHTDCAVTVVAPTCHSLGYTLHVCKNCGYAYRTDEQPATDDHKWGRWFETESGSCLEYRMHERSCLNEGCYEKQIEIMRDANGDALYGKHYVVVIKGQAATCVAPGYTDYERCVICGEITEAEVIPATGHIDNNKNGNCDVCNYVTNPSIGKCDCLCHNDSFFGKLLYNFVNFFWKLFKIQQGCQCGAQHW